MSEINILHLSDLHYDASNTKDNEIVLNALWKDLKKIKEEENVEPDMVIFSGDIVKKGDIDNNFDEVERNFITPLLEKVGLDYDFFFICPGNHDVQKNQINDIHEIGLDGKLKETAIVNDFLDDIDSNLEFFNRFQKFNDFKKTLLSRHTKTSNILFSTHRLIIKDIDIGIACLNSCWRSKCEGEAKGTKKKGQPLNIDKITPVSYNSPNGKTVKDRV
jgi:predicted MPP superfamily phosphohydrolase